MFTPVQSQGIPEDSLPRKLLNVRISLRLTQREVAARVGVNPSIVSMWERGERVPNKMHQGLLLKVFPELGVNS